MENHLLNLRLTLHQGKRRIYRTQDGITFLGWRLFPTHRRLVRGNVVRFERRLRAMQCAFEAGRVTWDEVAQRIASWNAHAAHGDTWRLRERLFERTRLHRAKTRQTAGALKKFPGGTAAPKTSGKN